MPLLFLLLRPEWFMLSMQTSRGAGAASENLTGALALLMAAILAVLIAGAIAIAVLKRKPGWPSISNAGKMPLVPGLEPPVVPEPPREPLARQRRLRALENHARTSACRLAAAMNHPNPPDPSGIVWVLAGPGPDGASVLAAARHLDALGIRTAVQRLTRAEKLGSEAAAQHKTLQAAHFRLLESVGLTPPEETAYVLAGAAASALTEAQRQGLQKALDAARARGIRVDIPDEFDAAFSPPPPQEDGVRIPVPDKPLTREASRLLDSLAQSHYGIAGAALMENAGYWAAWESLQIARGLAKERGGGTEAPAVVFLCGRGNNGGDGFVAARHLSHWGLAPRVFLLGKKDRMSDEARANLDLFEAGGGKVIPLFDESQWPLLEAALREAHLVLDALLGTGMSGEVRAPATEAIRRMNAARDAHPGAWILALDCPSGMDCNTGLPLGCGVRADVTLSFAAPKTGFSKGRGPELCGHVLLASIGLPRACYPRPGAGVSSG